MDNGPVKITVEAYVVKGMTTPFILGNDFTDQYSILIIRDEGESHLDFGKSRWRLRVESLTSPAYLTDLGHTFKVRIIPNFAARNFRLKVHHKNQKNRQKVRFQLRNSEVRAVRRTVIPPMTSKLTMVETFFPTNIGMHYVEKRVLYSGNTDNVFGAPDSMISTDQPYLHVSNFSNAPITIVAGQVLGIARNPRNWLDQKAALLETDKIQMETHASLVQQLSESLPQRSNPMITISNVI